MLDLEPFDIDYHGGVYTDEDLLDAFPRDRSRKQQLLDLRELYVGIPERVSGKAAQACWFALRSPSSQLIMNMVLAGESNKKKKGM